MGSIFDKAADVYRDYEVQGLPASGAHEPAKTDIRGLFSMVDTAIGAAEAGIAIVSTIAQRDAFYATPANQTKLVYVNNNNGSATDPANGIYEYVNGAARFAQSFYSGLAVAVQPLIDQGVARAEAWAEGTEPGGDGTRSAKEWADYTADLIANSSLRYNYVNTPTQATDAGRVIDRGSWIQKTPFARTIFETAAENIRIHGYSTLGGEGVFAQYAEFGMIVNGSYVQPFYATANGPFTATASLGVGPKVIEFVDGVYTETNNAVRGTSIVSIEADAPVSQQLPTPVNRTMFLVDSIGSGATASIGSRDGYIARLRTVTGDSLVALGYGFNTLKSTFGDGPRTTTIAQMVAANPARAVLTLGTNDWAFNSYATLSDVTAAWGVALDAMHAALPNMTVIVVSPIIRGDEGTNNAYGYTMDQMRTAIAASVTGRSWASYVNGKPFMTTADLVEGGTNGVHPNSTGHLKWARAIAPTLGYSLPADNAVLSAGPDANGVVTTPSSGVYRAQKTGGGGGFNSGFYTPLRTADFRYQIDVPAILDLMIGVSTAPSQDSGFASMLHQVYLNGQANIQSYDGSSGGSESVGSYSAGAHIWLDRTGSAVTFKQGADYATATTLRGPFTISGPLALDMSMFTQGASVDVRKIV